MKYSQWQDLLVHYAEGKYNFVSVLYPFEPKIFISDSMANHILIGLLYGRVLGFLAGSVAAGAAVYYYILDEYRLSNEMLTEDIYVRQCI